MTSPGRRFVEAAVATAEAAADRGPSRTLQIAPAGVSVTVTLVGDSLIDELAPGMLAAGQPPSDFHLWAFDGAGSGMSPPQPPWPETAYRARDEVAGWTDPPLLAAFDTAHATVSAIDLNAGAGVQWQRDAAKMAPWEGGAPLRQLVRWALSRSGAHLIHAAAVGDEAGGVLLIGRGGSGKSTSALAALAAGMRFVADDYTVVRVGAQITAHPAFGIAKATPASLALIAGLDDRADGARADWQGKLRLPVGDIVDPALPLRAIVWPEVSARTGAPTRVEPADVMREAAISTLFQLAGGADLTLEVLSTLIERLPVFRLEVGPDIERVPERLAEAIRLGAAVA